MGVLHSDRAPVSDAEMLAGLQEDRLLWEQERSAWRGLVYRGAAFFAIARNLIDAAEYNRIFQETSSDNPANAHWVTDSAE